MSGPCRVRTGDLYIANVALWPTELTAQFFHKIWCSSQSDQVGDLRLKLQARITPLILKVQLKSWGNLRLEEAYSTFPLDYQ